ncbi:JAB domain-containing protein [Algoriphagus sp. C2-6-M1]
MDQRLAEIGRALDLPIVDHVILSPEGYFSFVDEGEL